MDSQSVYVKMRNIIKRKELRFLCAGCVNTFFGYICSLVIYFYLKSVISIVFIAIISTIINITFSFFSYKLFVFRTKGNWIREYLRCYIVYGLSSIFGIIGIWFLVEMLKIPFWLSQACIIMITVIISYIGHSKYSFNNR